eukprot:982617_1
MNITMAGLDATGKTTILYNLKSGQIVETIPTIGFNVETVEYKNISFSVWDVGGQIRIRPLWRRCIINTQVLIWVIDSNDRERIDDSCGFYNSSKEVLHSQLAENELRDAVLLVFANKQDLPNAMSVNEVTERLGLYQLRNRLWHIQSCCATTVDAHGLYEGLDWLSNTLKKDYKNQLEKFEKRRKLERRQVIESQQKSILLISGYIREFEFYEFETNKQTMTFIPVSVAKVIHLMYHDPFYHCDKYTFYGEYILNRDFNENNSTTVKIDWSGIVTWLCCCYRNNE